jgi:8-oxo-dGTP diphosphatase
MKKVTAAIMYKGGKVFIARRGPAEKLAGYWEFPGGKVEDGETSEECLKRELFEEFGVEAEIGAFYCDSTYHYGHGSIKLLCYLTEHISGAFQPTVHDQIKWADIFELKNFEFAPADVPVVEKIMCEHEFFK